MMTDDTAGSLPFEEEFLRAVESLRREGVPENYQCPNCNERRVDWLLLGDDEETVLCLQCMTVYRI